MSPPNLVGFGQITMENDCGRCNPAVHCSECSCQPALSDCDRASIHPYDGYQTITSSEHPCQKRPLASEPDPRPSRSEHVVDEQPH